ncbi:MAG: UvrB/UvrC motif-containing protein [Candidatus Hydrogenedentes bacterium]|nr:UvrB/UvrC motif-containing protein [Candidatus Hydrogenedentota bacterium]
MICQKCHKRPGTIRYAEVVDGRVTDQFWCSECLALQRNGGEGFEISAVAPTRPTRNSIHSVVSRVVRAQQTCPECDTPLQEIFDTNRVGCVSCYDAFGNELTELLSRLHSRATHTGKSAHLTDARSQLRSDLRSKRSLLRSVLKAEDYEEAATLRDEIRALETGLYVSESGAD